jgi:Carboxypeptidase regulatory-like domain
MIRKLGVGAVLVCVLVAGIWLVFVRGRGEATSAKPANARTAVVPKPAASSAAPAAGPAPRGRSPRWSIDRDPEGELRLEGQVLGPDGKAAGGATVWLESAPPRTTKTEDDGTFSFDKLVGRTYGVSATQGELLGGPVRSKLTSHSEPVVIRLAEAAAVVVTVVDDAKRPIVDAEVKLRDGAALAVKTTEHGTARLAPVRPGWLAVVAAAAGYAPGNAFTTVGSAGATGALTITLHKGYAVAGRVIDDAGKPIAGARITASEGLGGEADRDGADAATTDAKGGFTIAALASGSHRLRAADGEHAPAISPPITVADRPVGNVEIVMTAGGVLSGRVVDASHKLAPFATVRVAGRGQQMWQTESRQATSDAKGEFELRGLARTKLQARAESDVAASQLVDADLTDKPRIARLELVLDVTGTIAGVVVDETGQLVPEVQVNAYPDVLGGASTEGLALAGMSSVTSGGGGEFVIHGLPEGTYRLWAARQAARFAAFGDAATTAKTGDQAVRITLPAPGTLTGKIVLAGTNAAPALASVAVGFQPPTPASGGVFQIKDLAPGSYDVTFRGLEFAELIQHDVKIEPGKATDLGTVVVARGRRLTGKVVDHAGTPVAGAKVKVGRVLISSADAGDSAESFESMAGIRSAVSDQNGAFELIGVPATATHVMAEHPDLGRSLGVDVAEGDADPPPVTLELRGFGSIAGKVTRQGQPLADVAIGESSKGGGAQGQFTKTGGDGAFVLAKVPEGEHVLNVMQRSMMSMKSTSVTVQVTAGKQTTANIVVPVGNVTLTVQIHAKAGNQLDAAQVFLFAGQVTMTTGKQLVDGIFQSAVQGSKIWLGAGKPMPAFPELAAGDYSICSLPITGSMTDTQFLQRMQQNIPLLKVYCQPAHLAAAPDAQAVEVELPAMTPLPPPAK